MRIAFASCVMVCLSLVGAARFDALKTAESFFTRTAAKIDKPLKTVKIERGDLLCTISASGVVKPEELVEVGAQVTGKIDAFGFDSNDPTKFINYGSIVHKGDVLARIDPAIYQARVDQAAATIEVAESNLAKMFIQCDHLKNNWLRVEALLPDKAVSETEYERTKMNYQVAKENLNIGKAVVKQNVASLRIAQSNLDNTIIKSPIDGVIVDRRVDIGQTVVASFNAPGLFLIAKDLRQMQIWASVGETEISWIRPGVPARFSLNARPNKTFRGKVAQIRLNASREQGFASYTVVIDANDSEGMLPYQTADIRFDVLRQSDVLLVPNEALRPLPHPLSASNNGNSQLVVDLTTSKPREKNNSPQSPACSAGSESTGKPKYCNCLYIKEGDRSRTVNVQTGVTNGAMTEVKGQDIAEGMEVCL